MEPLDSLYQTALKDYSVSFLFCGDDPAAFEQTVGHLLTFLENAHCLALMPSGSELTSRYVNVTRDSEMAGLDYLRSALRQDPDALVLDARASTTLNLLAQAKLTGHQLIFNYPKSAEQALLDCFSEVAKENEFMALEFLFRAILLDLQNGKIEKVWQVRKSSDSALTLAPLLEREETGWKVLEPFEARPQPTSTFEPEVLTVPEDWPDSAEPFMQELTSHLGPHRRTAWAPRVGESGHTSKYGQFGGVPRLKDGESWPCCVGCGERMSLVLEIELPNAPAPFQEKVGSDGLFQFYYCQNHECTVERAWEAFQGNSLARIVSGKTTRTSETSTSDYGALPILDWVEMLEGPDWEERDQLAIDDDFLGSDLFDTFALMAQSWSDSNGYYDEILEYFGLNDDTLSGPFSYVRTLPGDKLLGWPAWSQAVEYPNCPKCGTRMEMLVQINNDGHGSDVPGFGSALGQVFAADGNGHISYCPQHGELTFAWACG